MVRTGPEENKWEQEVAVPAFEEAHPEMKVNLLIIDQDDIAVKREAMIAAGEPLHVWSTNWGGDGFASDRQRGLITDLTPLIERDSVDTSVFIPEVLDIYETDGKIWGLPFLTTGSYLFYNMDLFDAAGVEYPPTSWDDHDWTWDAAMEVAKELTQNLRRSHVSATYGLIQNRGQQTSKALHDRSVQFPWPEDAYDTGLWTPTIFTLNTCREVINAYQKHHVRWINVDARLARRRGEALSQLGGTFRERPCGHDDRTVAGAGGSTVTSRPMLKAASAGALRRFRGDAG